MALCRRAQEKVDVVDAASLVEPANLAPSTVLAVTAVRGAAMNRSGAAVVATPRAELRQLCAEAFLQQVQVRSTRAPPAAPPHPSSDDAASRCPQCQLEHVCEPLESGLDSPAL